MHSFFMVAPVEPNGGPHAARCPGTADRRAESPHVLRAEGQPRLEGVADLLWASALGPRAFAAL